jgi:glycosyltransferase involved in cell wall biosynthesis
MDLHPEVEDRLGLLPGGRAVAAPLHAAGRFSYRGADFVVALGPHMARRIREGKGVPGERIREIPVWSDPDEVRPVPHGENPLRRELGLEDAFVVMYSGNAGLAHRFEEVCHAMEVLDGDEGVEFVFVGGGPRAGEIRRFVRERGIGNFRYLDYLPRERLGESLSVADVHLLTLRPDMAGLAAPGKLQGILAAGRPCVMVGPRASEPGEVLSETGTGVVVEPGGDPRRGGARVADVLRELRADPDRRRAMGRRAREAFEARFDRERGCRAWEALLREVVGEEARAVRPSDGW